MNALGIYLVIMITGAFWFPEQFGNTLGRIKKGFNKGVKDEKEEKEET